MPHPQGANCREDHDSAIYYGNARIIEDPLERLEALNIFNRALAPGAPDIPSNISMKCYAVEVTITNMTGRRQRKGMERTYWEHTFTS